MSLTRSRQRGAKRRTGRAPGRTSASGLISQGRRLLSGPRGRAMGRRRSRGISGAELRGFNRVSRLLGNFGMVPRKMRGARPRRRRT